MRRDLPPLERAARLLPSRPDREATGLWALAIHRVIATRGSREGAPRTR